MSKQGKKITGLVGWMRHLISVFIACIYTLFISIALLNIATNIAMKFANSSINPILTFTISYIVTFILLVVLLSIFFHLLGILFGFKKNDFFIRTLSTNEYNYLLNHKLIHYTNFLSDDSISEYKSKNKLKITGNSSAKSNYSMHWNEAKERYVWFHQSENLNDEPSLDSFFFSHGTEGIPRKYKIIINPRDIDKTNLYIRPCDNAIILKGDFYGECELNESFNWYNDKIYFWKVLKDNLSLTNFNIIFYFGFRQIIGNMRDLLSNHR